MMSPNYQKGSYQVTKFTDLILPEPLHRAAAELGYETPTPIQEQAIPWLCENEGDLIALAQTGTGKTAAFGLPIISKTDIENRKVQSLILCPTRELCLQITSDLNSYAKYIPRVKVASIYGGSSIIKQKDALKAGVQIVVGTPGRVYDLICQNALHVESIERLVLDEADEMLNMGFKEELFNILEHTPKAKQVMLFSATMSNDVEKISSTFMEEPFRISVGEENKGADNILHYFYKVHARDKYLALKRIADMNPGVYGIVFCKTRTETQEIANKLQHDGYNADALHGDLSQGQREIVMTRFRSKYVRLLIATDVAARGLDVDDLTHIINYHLPLEPEIYIHRSGRTGRAGKSGISLSIIHSKELGILKKVEQRLGKEIVYTPVPTGREICEKQLFHFVDSIERISLDTDQIEGFMPKVYKKLGWLSREELIQRFVAVEFNRFLNYYKDNRDLSQEGGSEPKDKSKILFSKFKINIGAAHGMTKREIMRYVNQLRVARSIEIGFIDIFENHTMIEIDSEFDSAILKGMARTKLFDIIPEVELQSTKRVNTKPVKGSDSKRDFGDSYDKPRKSYSSYREKGSGQDSRPPRDRSQKPRWQDSDRKASPKNEGSYKKDSYPKKTYKSATKPDSSSVPHEKRDERKRKKRDL